MFATHHYMETMDETASDRPGKRGRDEEHEFTNGPVSFSEHRNVSLIQRSLDLIS